MKNMLQRFVRGCEIVAAILMAAMFLTFIVQIFIRYTSRLDWVVETFPFLDPAHFGWTLEFCLVLWVWIIFFGNAFIVRDRDHVSFDLLYYVVPSQVRRGFVVVAALAICGGLLWSIEPTWSKFYILRLKKTATLSPIFGDGLRMRDIYFVYFLFLGVVAVRYAWRAYRAALHDVYDQDLIEDPEAGQAANGSVESGK